MTDAGTEVGAPRANAIVHWPSGPVPCCLHHADALLKIGAAMGMRPAVFLLSDWDDGAPLSWVICGGESGPNARPIKPDWVRNLRDQCTFGGVPFVGTPFHFKQWGGRTSKANGKMLDGREWCERPHPGAER